MKKATLLYIQYCQTVWTVEIVLLRLQIPQRKSRTHFRGSAFGLSFLSCDIDHIVRVASMPASAPVRSIFKMCELLRDTMPIVWSVMDPLLDV